MAINIKQLAILLIMSLPTALYASNAELFQRAESLLSNNQAEQAMILLEPSMEDNAGIPQYDYLLGRAALAQGQPNLAVFSLERAVLSKPNFGAARLTLAQAYVALGERSQAKKELNHILNTTFDPQLRLISQAYLQQLNRPRYLKPSLALDITLGGGMDTNANSATTIDEFFGVVLSEKSKAQESPVNVAQLVGRTAWPMGRRWRFDAGANVYSYNYADASFVNTLGGGINTGISFLTSKSTRHILQLQYQMTEVDGTLNNTQSNMQLVQQNQFARAHSLLSSLRGGRVSYANYPNKDVNQVNAAFQYQYLAQTRDKQQIATSIAMLLGKDIPVLADSPYERNYAGIMLGTRLGFAKNKAELSASVGYMTADFPKPFVGFDRKDSHLSGSVKLNYQFTRHWSAGPSLRYMHNQSSVDLYEYERTQAMFFIRHQV